MTDKTCKTCKHWKNQLCRLVEYNWENQDVEFTGDAVGLTDPGGLITGPDFGCIKHEPKEQQ